VCAYAFKSKVHCGSALGPGCFGLFYYCTLLVCVPAVSGGLVVWRHNNKNKNKKRKKERMKTITNATTNDVVEVEGEDSGHPRLSEVCRHEEQPDTPGYLRGDRVRRDVGDFRSWVCPPWLARDATQSP